VDTTCLTNGQRQTAILNYEISTMWESKPRTRPPKTSIPLMGPERATRTKTLQAIQWW